MLGLDGKEEEELVAALFEVKGNDVDARNNRCHLDAQTLTLTGADRVDKVFVIKGDDKVLALVLDIDLLVGRSGGGVCHDLEHVALGSKTDGSTVASDDPLLGNYSRTLKCAEKSVAVNGNEGLMCLEDNSVKVDVLALDKTGIEGHILKVADEVLTAHMHHNSVVLAVGKHTVELLDSLCGNDIGISDGYVIVGTVDDIGFCSAFCHLEAIAGNDRDLISLDAEESAV